MTDLLTTAAVSLAAWLACCVALMQALRWLTSPEAVQVIEQVAEMTR
jgi:hypothetical protein